MSNRKKLWFGTEQRMQWVTTPNQGADMSPESWGVDGTTLNGHGFARHAWSSHKNYIFEWPDSSSVEEAALMEAYRSGIYGRGLIYFVDPLIYERNILPERWAAPSIAVGDEGKPLIPGVYPEGVVTSGGSGNNLPVQSAYYNLDDVALSLNVESSVFVPVPEGYTLYLGAFYEVTGAGRVVATPVDSNGNNGTSGYLTELSNNATNIVPDTFSGGSGVRVSVGKSASVDSSVTLSAMVARLYPTGKTPPPSFTSGPWVPGLGNAGCRFIGNPTYIANSSESGGRIGYAATFKEVG